MLQYWQWNIVGLDTDPNFISMSNHYIYAQIMTPLHISDKNLMQDVSRIVKQMDKHGQVADMLAQHMRCMQSYYHKSFVDAYNALEKSAKYPECLIIWNYLSPGR